MTKRNIIIIVVSALIVAAAVDGYFYWKAKVENKIQPPSAAPAAFSTSSIANNANAINQSVSQGLLPSIGGAANPIGTSSNLNPTSQTNPFNSVKTNPFQ